MKSYLKYIALILLCIYLVVLSQQILFKYLPLEVIVKHLTLNFEREIYWGSHNFIPFKTIYLYLFSATNMNFNVRFSNLAGNVIGFMPFGFLMPLISKKFFNLKVITLTTFCLSLAYELTQLIFRFGSFDVDDLILNTLGGIIGFMILYLILNLINKKKIIREKT